MNNLMPGNSPFESYLTDVNGRRNVAQAATISEKKVQDSRERFIGRENIFLAIVFSDRKALTLPYTKKQFPNVRKLLFYSYEIKHQPSPFRRSSCLL